MGYDRWMLSPISRGEASQDNERAGGGGGVLGRLGERELKNHMVGCVCVCVREAGGLKKAPE